MEVVNRLAAVSPNICDDAVSIDFETLVPGDVSHLEKEMSKQPLVFSLRTCKTGNLLLGNHQNMNRSLWIHIPESEAVFIIVDDVGRDFTVNDLLENGHACNAAEFRKKVKGLFCVTVFVKESTRSPVFS